MSVGHSWPWLGGRVSGYIEQHRIAIDCLDTGDRPDHAKRRVLEDHGIPLLLVYVGNLYGCVIQEIRAASGIIDYKEEPPPTGRDRACLRCGKIFLSAGPWNRFCPKCAGSSEFQDDLREQDREHGIRLPDRRSR